MLPACFQLSERLFPAVRAHAAHRLTADGWTQGRIAAALDVSQAMVSKYLAKPAQDDVLVARLADELVEGLHGQTGPDSWCGPLAATTGDAEAEALRDLLAAERLLTARPPLRVVPQIGMNLARALPGATGPESVLAYPGRLVEGGGRLLRPAPPAPRGSKHLSERLLHVRGAGPNPACLASIRGGADVLDAARRAGRKVVQVPAGAPTAAFAADADAWHDAGAVGIEPCLYLSGPDAQSVAQAILHIHDQVTP